MRRVGRLVYETREKCRSRHVDDRQEAWWKAEIHDDDRDLAPNNARRGDCIHHPTNDDRNPNDNCAANDVRDTNDDCFTVDIDDSESAVNPRTRGALEVEAGVRGPNS